MDSSTTSYDVNRTSPFVISGHVTEDDDDDYVHRQTRDCHPLTINGTCESETGTALEDDGGTQWYGGGGTERNPFILAWYFQLVYSVAFVAMVIVAAGGNMVVVWIVMAHKRMRTVTNYFLVNLAVADAMISLLNTLFNFVYMLVSDWPFGRNYCKFSQFIAPCNISTSVFTFMAIALDR